MTPNPEGGVPTERNGADPGARLLAVDMLRGAAVSMVIAYHVASPVLPAGAVPVAHPVTPAFPVLLGYSGVHLFLVLSGFCIHMRFARQRPPRRIDFARFWQRRFVRLYPPYVAAMTVGILWVMLTGLLVTDLHGFPPYYRSWGDFRLDVAAHLVMLQLFWVTAFGGVYNGPLWSLALEEQLYALYLPFVHLRRHRGLPIAMGAALTVTLAWRVAGVYGFGWLPLLPPIRVPEPWTFDLWRMIGLCHGPARWIEWCLGALAAEAMHGVVRLPRLCGSFAVAALLLVAASASLFHPLGWIVNDLLFGAGYFVLLVALCRMESDGAGPFRKDPVTRQSVAASRWASALSETGLRSYSLYLLHTPVLFGAYNLIDFVVPDGDLRRAACRVVLPPLLTWVAAAVFFQLVERRFMSASRARHAESKQADPVSSAGLPGAK